MRRRSAGQLIAATGAVCLLFYTLIALSGPATTAGHVGKVLLYIAIIALPVGAAMYVLAKIERS